MKKSLLVLLFGIFAYSLFAGPEKKPKMIDHYFLDVRGDILSEDYSDLAMYEVKVLQDADSIKVHTINLYSETPVSMETYQVLNDSIQRKWGTQVSFDALGNVRRIQYINLALGTDEIVQYDDSNRVEQHIYKDVINNKTRSVSYYKNGTKKGVSESAVALDGKFTNTLTTWFPNGKVMREQNIENGQTVSMRIFDEEGAVSFAMPVHDGDSIFYNKDGNISSRHNAVKRAVVAMVNDSIFITKYDNSGRKISKENFMSYNPESPVAWGTQEYYYTTTPQPVDSLVQFRSVLGDNLVENTFYEDGKIKSSTILVFDNVMVADREYKQYYPTGILRRIEKHHGTTLVEGHIYDSEGNEQFPFYEFKP